MPRLVNFEIHRLCHLMDRQTEDSDNEKPELTRAQCRVLHFLNENRGKDIYQRDIEERFKMRRSTVSVMLSTMECRGYIKRVCVEQDARLRKIAVTEKAKALDDKIKHMIESYNAMLIQGISEQELGAFFAVLDRIRSNIENNERSEEA